MSNMQQSFEAGQTKGNTQAKVQQLGENVQDSASAAKDKTASAVQSARESTPQNKDEASGFLQQKGEQVKNMAQGAMDSVKNTLGMNDQKK